MTGVALCLILCAAGAEPARAGINFGSYGISIGTQDSVRINALALTQTDSLLRAGPLRAAASAYNIQKPRAVRNRTPDFYLLALLTLLLGAIRYTNPRYFSLLAGAYRNPGNGHQWRDMLQAAALPNLAMNAYFAAVAGAYIYYISAGTQRFLGYKAPLVLLLLIAGMGGMYVAKYLVIRFSGWAFRVESLAGQYLFNVFLVNKIIGIALLPFVIIIAFAGHEWAEPLTALSGAVVIGLLVTRYLRSWPALYAFFKGSRFHFFTYLCASEILPMAVLVKWLLHLLR